MKKLLTLLGLISVSVVNAGDEVDREASATPDGLIRIVNTRGKIDIVGWDKPQISIRGELDDLTEALIFDVSAGKALIEVKMRRGNGIWGDGSDLEIKVPRLSRVDFDGVSTEVSAINIHGGLRLKSISGDIRAEKVGESLILKTVSGEIELEKSKGNLQATTVSGGIEVASHVGDIDVESVSGDIVLVAKDNKKLFVRNISGETKITSTLLKGARVELKSISGDIELDLPDDVDANFSLDAGVSGHIENDLSDNEVRSNRIGREKLNMILGQGSASILINTISADIRLE